MKPFEDINKRYFDGVITATEYAGKALVEISASNIDRVFNQLPPEVIAMVWDYVSNNHPDLPQMSIGNEPLPSPDQLRLAAEWLRKHGCTGANESLTTG